MSAVQKEKCGVYGGTYSIGGRSYDVYCALPKGHKSSFHVSATMGRIQEWEGTFVKDSPDDRKSVLKCPKGHALLYTNYCLMCSYDASIEEMKKFVREGQGRREEKERREKKEVGQPRTALVKREEKRGFWAWLRSLFKRGRHGRQEKQEDQEE